MTRDEVIGGISALRRLSCECVYVRTYGEEEKHIRVSAHCVGQGTLRSEQVITTVYPHRLDFYWSAAVTSAVRDSRGVTHASRHLRSAVARSHPD